MKAAKEARESGLRLALNAVGQSRDDLIEKLYASINVPRSVLQTMGHVLP